ncbi:unnamed protein product [Rotaria socialis]|uniref:DUF4789 domain-containing protein n=1 Tax=Rotaria socialis TaxID=392032 RepID=A0A821SQ73_9BILA|nr:unnamed protein product [Rotaria socialis]
MELKCSSLLIITLFATLVISNAQGVVRSDHKGHCAPRLCPPDRIFVPATQQCHDPQDTSVCPDSRELFLTAYGTAICDCPVGTVESSNGLNVVVCEPILSKGHFCKEGQVIWFKDFNSPAQCLPDPCHGKNLQRLPGSLPFVPSQNNGECHQLGQTSGVCLPGLIYALHLPTLSGVCETLENLGYEQFNQTDLAFLNRRYGKTVVKNNALVDNFGQMQLFGTWSMGY